MYWRIVNDSKNFRGIVDSGNIYNTQDFLKFEGSKNVDSTLLKFSLDDRNNLPIGNFLPANRGLLFSSREVFELFHDEIKKSDNCFYSGTLDSESLLILAVLEERMGFDFDKSEFRSFDDGDVYQISTLRLVDGFETNLDMFRLADNFGLRFELIVSDNFKLKYEVNRLSGLRFEST